jgi:hypothetical protein
MKKGKDRGSNPRGATYQNEQETRYVTFHHGNHGLECIWNSG